MECGYFFFFSTYVHCSYRSCLTVPDEEPPQFVSVFKKHLIMLIFLHSCGIFFSPWGISCFSIAGHQTATSFIFQASLSGCSSSFAISVLPEGPDLTQQMHLGKCVWQVKSDLIFPEFLHSSDQIKQARRIDCRALGNLHQYETKYGTKLSSSRETDFLPWTFLFSWQFR